MEPSINRIRINVTRPRVGSQIESLVREFSEFRIQGPDVGRDSDLLIQELGIDVDKDLYHIQALLRQGLLKEVFLLSESDDPMILRKIIRSGVSELLPLPLNVPEVRDALTRFRSRNLGNGSGDAKKNLGTVINVLGSKGGVGTTTLAVNLAVALQAQKESWSVALVDLNAACGEVSFFLELTPRYHWGEISRNLDRLDALYLSNIMTAHPSGVQVLSSPNDLSGQETISPNMVEQVLNLMRTMFDFIVVDSGKALGPVASKVIEISGRTLLLTFLNLPCLSNTRRMLDAMKHLDTGTDHIRVLVNRASRRWDIDRKDAQSAIGRQISWFISNDYQSTMNAINTGSPLVESTPRSSVTNEIIGLAKVLAGKEVKKEKSRGRKFFFL